MAFEQDYDLGIFCCPEQSSFVKPDADWGIRS